MNNKIATNIQGLDEILLGGLIPNRSYLIKGGPGTGKSTVGYHFLQQGIENGEETLFITLGESKSMIQENAEKLGIDLGEVHFLDLTPSEQLKVESKNYSVFSASEIEQQPLVEAIVQSFEKHNPKRVLLDSITMLRMLNHDDYKFRSFGLSLIKYMCNNGATLMLISETHPTETETDSEFWVDGIIELQYQTDWRRIAITKYRGSDFMHGSHAFNITGGGAQVFPQLRPNNYKHSFKDEVLSSGIDEIDKLLHGGIERGTTTLLTGASGVGKTNLGIQFLNEAASRNQRSVIYSFEESRELIMRRSRQIGIPIQQMVDNGNLRIEPVEPLSYSPDEFSTMVRREVEENDTQMVMIDTMGGYGMAVREENTLERLHSLTVYLQNMGVTSFLINETQNVAGEFVTTDMHASYLADNIIFLRYLEINGELRKAIGVLKKRLSDFEKSIREFSISPDGIKVGDPLHNVRGILSGSPEIIG